MVEHPISSSFKSLLGLVLASALLAACSSGPARRIPPAIEWHPARDTLTTYDSNQDRILTREELNAGLKRDFDLADTNKDGVLDVAEISAVNEKRWQEQGSTATPLIDWRQSGRVDFNGFAASARSLFAQMDRDGDNQLSAKEINPEAEKARERAEANKKAL